MFNKKEVFPNSGKTLLVDFHKSKVDLKNKKSSETKKPKKQPEPQEAPQEAKVTKKQCPKCTRTNTYHTPKCANPECDHLFDPNWTPESRTPKKDTKAKNKEKGPQP